MTLKHLVSQLKKDNFFDDSSPAVNNSGLKYLYEFLLSINSIKVSLIALKFQLKIIINYKLRISER